MNSDTHLILIEVIMAAGFSAITFFIGYCVNEVKRVKKEVLDVVERERFESIMAQRRIDVHDTIASEITRNKFNSRSIVERGHDLPALNVKLRKLMNEEQ